MTGGRVDQQVLDLLPDGVVAADRDGLVTVVSPVAARMLDLDPAAAVGKPLTDVLTLTDQDGNEWCAVNDPYGGLRIRTGVPEQPWLLPLGTEVLVTARLHRETRGGPVCAVVLSLRSGRGRERLDRDRSDLVATVAHELRSPLTGVKGFVHAILDRWDKLTDEQKRLMLGTVVADADRLSRLIVELLDVARIDTGRLQLHRRPTDIGLKAERAVEMLAHSTSRTIEVDVRGECVADADPDKVVQVIVNLIENAIKHGDGDIQVSVATDDAEFVVVMVADQGTGIPVELRRRAFTKFWTEGAGGGSGLGLYMVAGLVRAHGGTVTVDDNPAGGARVTVTWPRART